MKKISLDRNIRDKRKYIIYAITVLIILFSVYEFLQIATIYKDMAIQNEVVYKIDEMYPYGYDIKDNTFINAVGDAQIDLGAINQSVSIVHIIFEELLEQDMTIEAYYSLGDGYSEENVVRMIAKQGSKELVLNINQEIESLRVDIGSNQGETFKLEAITLNDKNIAREPISWLVVKVICKIIFCIVIAFIVWNIFFSEWRIYKKYAISVTILGICYIFIMTPLAIPDEPHHYHSSYKVSNILMFQWDDLNQGEADHFDYRDLNPHYNVKSAYYRYHDPIFKHSADRVEIPKPNDVSYPIQYIPQAIGITIGRVFQLNFIGTFYLGRLFNLLFFVACGTLAIKIIPFGKNIIFIVSILPMTIHQAASFSYDAFINGVSMVLVAYIMYEIYSDKQMSNKEAIIITALGMLLAPAKIVYSLIGFLALLIPKNNFKSRKNEIILKAFMIGIPFLSIFIWKGLSLLTIATGRDLLGAQQSLNWEGYNNYTLKFLFQNPLDAMGVFINTFKQRGVGYIYSMIGSHLAGLTIPIRSVYINLYILLLIFFAISKDNYEDKDLRIYTSCRYIMFGVSGMVIVLIMLSMMIGWTSDFRKVIEGVQGRYFIPILPITLLAMKNNLINTKYNIGQILLSIGLIIQIPIVIQILNYTF